jgi:Galactose oxidase-like, Early set domain
MPARGKQRQRAADLDIKEVEAARIEPDVQRRLLDLLNGARRLEDLGGLDRAEIGTELARRILDKRDALGAYGFRHVKELAGISGLTRNIFDLLIRLCGPAAYGEWKMPYSTRNPDGTAYHVAHAAVLRTARVLFLPEADTKTTLLWDPSDEVNPQFEFLVDQPDERLFCSGHAFLSDGQLLVAGGGGGGPSGVDRAYKFDPVAETWTKTAGNMTIDRWYPTLVTLGDEHRVLVAGGLPSNDTAEIYDELTDSFTAIAGPQSRRSFPQLYPGLHLLPGGEIFYTRTGFGSFGQGPGGGDPTLTSAYFRFTGLTSGEWVELADIMEYTDRVRGMSVLLLDRCHPTARVLVVGGTAAPGSETAETIELSTLTPTWDMPTNIAGGSSRINVNAVLLPDGKVFVVGGTTTPTSPCAMFDPSSSSWSEMARANYRKQYHSVGVLLPSGKVAATGGSNYGGGSNTVEIFSPPYLFNADGSAATRPTIANLPALVHHGQHFDLETPEAADIEKVVFVWPMAVTHQTDSGQRRVEAEFHHVGTTLKVTAPDQHMGAGAHTHATAPRGYYMVFILDSAGVPSEGKFIFLH